MNKIRSSLIALAALASFPAAAGPYADGLSTCLSDNTNGKERKELARWMFIAMATHPEIKDLSATTSDIQLRTNQFVGQLVTRLLSEQCAPQTRLAIDKEGSTALQEAFGFLGKLAMQELMSNEAVAASISGFEAHMDKAKIQAALTAK